MKEPWATYHENRSAALPPLGIAWFESELRTLGVTADQAVLSEFHSRISGLEPWVQDAEMKLLLEEVRDGLESRSDYGGLSYGADTSWQTEARDKLNEVDAKLFDDLREQEEREKAKDVERRAKCAELGRQLRLDGERVTSMLDTPRALPQLGNRCN